MSHREMTRALLTSQMIRTSQITNYGEIDTEVWYYGENDTEVYTTDPEAIAECGEAKTPRT